MIQIGKIVAPFGIKGEVKIYPMTNLKEMFLDFDHVIIKGKTQDLKMEIQKSRIHKNTIVATFEGIDSIEDAEKYINSELYVEEDQLPELEEDEQYLYQILEMEVYNKEGEYLGIITDIFENGAHSVYVVKDGESEILLPGIPSVVLEKDLKQKRMIVNILPGLLD